VRRVGLLAALHFVALSLLINPGAAPAIEDLYGLDLHQLHQLRMASGATLTRTEAGKVPASVTTITRRMIHESGARSLDELLDLYVPNLVLVGVAGGPGPKVGLRGVVGGRNHKTLVLVNGRVTNQRTIYGAISERFLPMLGDVEKIEVVRGPGSSIYGPGAINGVISIQTLAQQSVDGVHLAVRQGFVEGYSLAEVKASHSLGLRSQLFGYYGIADYRGAEAKDAPMTFSRTSTMSNGVDLFTAGVPIRSGIAADNRSLGGDLLHKAHAEYRGQSRGLWVRFVRGGILQVPARSLIENLEIFDRQQGLQYQQVTIQGEQALALGQEARLQLRAGYDVQDVVKDPGGPDGQQFTAAFREDEFSTRALLSWTPSDSRSAAVGVEYSREWFGKDPWSLTADGAHNSRTELSPWATNAVGLLSEYQWQIDPRWTAFLGGRLDRHSFTQWMVSPKAALLFSPGAAHTSKLLYNRSVRKNDDIELKLQHDADPEFDGEIEQIDAIELRHDYEATADLTLSAAGFWQDVDIIAWAGSRNRSSPVGSEQIYGLETEATYRGRRHQVWLSYAFTRLRDFVLADVNLVNQTETSAPYGYGNDLHHFPRHVGKMTWNAQVRPRLRLMTSLRLFWGFDGAEAYARYNNEVLQQLSLTLTDDGRTDAFEGSAFVNLGVAYDVTRRIQINAHAHNVLGWLQHDVNKRNFFGRMGGYRSQAPAISLQLSHRLTTP
jgi:outer membrane receptor for ferrienterochelin and colicins